MKINRAVIWDIGGTTVVGSECTIEFDKDLPVKDDSGKEVGQITECRVTPRGTIEGTFIITDPEMQKTLQESLSRRVTYDLRTMQ